jgi:septin family protein
LTIIIKRLIHEFSDDTTSLLHHVYRTKPMLEAAPGEFLSFKTEKLEEESQPEVLSKVSDVVTLYQTSSKKKRKADMKALKEQIQAKLAEKKLQREQIKYSEPPRYDDVFFEGVNWLDSLAGGHIQEQEGGKPMDRGQV